jgi:hypothetical protein
LTQTRVRRTGVLNGETSNPKFTSFAVAGGLGSQCLDLKRSLGNRLHFTAPEQGLLLVKKSEQATISGKLGAEKLH